MTNDKINQTEKTDKTNKLDKQKDKIRKLLELSLSDNENEASIALKQAMSLMNAHNITKDEVYGQNMANKIITTPYYRIPDWYVTLHNTMAKVSGCFCVYRNGDSFLEELATIQITGRQRDVDNTEYLIVFLSREVEKNIKQYKQQLAQQGIKLQLSARVKAYRMGFINKVYKKMYECQNQFFSDANKSDTKTNTSSGTELVCIDIASRVDEAKTYYTDVLGQTFARASSQARYISSSMSDGSKAAENLSINQAVNQQESIKGLGIL